jgi:hypothetical protein
MIVKWRLGYRNSISSIDVIRETESCLWVKDDRPYRKIAERRVMKTSAYEMYFDTWEDAYKYLVDRIELSLSECQARMKDLQSQLDIVKTYQNPSQNTQETPK